MLKSPCKHTIFYISDMMLVYSEPNYSLEVKLIDFTVAIRAYNSGSFLPAILDRLRFQVEVETVNWEVIIIDNNSTDNTAEIVNAYQAVWPNNIPLRYYFESRQGAGFARHRAINEARGNLIGFLDDDNLPTPNWVAAACAFGKSHSRAGAYGSQIQGEFEVEPPEDFQRIESFLAIKDRGTEPNLYDPAILSLPPGAGLVVRRKVWLDHVPDTQVLQGPVKKSLTQKGEDFEALMHIGNAGWEIWYNPEMQIYHQIPSWRLEKNYLVTLIRCAGLNTCYLRTLNVSSWQIPVISLKLMIGSLRRLIVHLFKYGTKIRTDIVAACEMEFFLSCFLSPFYLLAKKGKT